MAGLGPVSDLEARVQPEWWKGLFNSLYLKTDGDVVEDGEITRGETDSFVAALRLRRDARVLDLCCGQGRHALELARRGFKNVEGFDFSRYLIRRARVSAASEGLRARFRDGDARDTPYAAGTFDAVMLLGNSFGYFEHERDDLRILAEAARVLSPGGTLLIDIADGDYLRRHFEPRSWEWIDQHYFVCRERSLSSDRRRLISREVITRVERGVLADQFYAERLYNARQLKALLGHARFGGVRFHGRIDTRSQRNQDLGMMVRRIVVTAQSLPPARRA